jgi:predicted neuraminidase
MLTVGHVVAYLPTTPSNVRNSEGCFFRLKDGSLLYAYSHFGASGHDDADACIYAIRSEDEGDSWGSPTLLFGLFGGHNVMCPSLMRMANGDIGMFFSYRDHTDEPGGNSYMHTVTKLVRSSDEGKTWSEPICVSPDGSNYTFENGHAIRLQSGRILVPNAYHPFSPCGYRGMDMHGQMCFQISDDDGYTWRMACKPLEGPSEEWSASGLQETMVYQQENGRIRAFARTDLGCQYESYSDDDGITWTQPMPNRNFTSPCAPMMMKRAGKYTVALLNPIPRFITATYGVVDDRSPLVCMISEDDGRSFPVVQVLDNRGHVRYPDMFDGGDYFLVGYQQLNDGVVRKVSLADVAP